jgi:hypothetical protein
VVVNAVSQSDEPNQSSCSADTRGALNNGWWGPIASEMFKEDNILKI